MRKFEFNLEKLNMCWYLGEKNVEIDKSNCAYFDMILKVIGDHGDVDNPAIPMLFDEMYDTAKSIAISCLK